MLFTTMNTILFTLVSCFNYYVVLSYGVDMVLELKHERLIINAIFIVCDGLNKPVPYCYL